MFEFSVPTIYETTATDNVAEDVFANERDFADHVALKRKVAGQWVPVSCREFAADVRELAAGLVGAGIEPGDRVGLMSRTRYEWAVVDYAIHTVGAVTVPVYPTSSLEQVEWILGDSGAVAVIVETDEHAEKVTKAHATLPALRHLWEIEGGRLEGLAEVMAYGAQVSAAQVDARRADIRSADIASIVYTSGTTGRPKGCVLTHANLVSNVRNAIGNDGLTRVFDEQHFNLLFLPLSHSYAQLILYGSVHARCCVGLTDLADAPAELPVFRPTVVLSVPRVWEKAYNSAKHKAEAEGHGKIFSAAEATALAYSEALDAGSVDLVLRMKHALYDRLVYRKLRAALGGRIQYAWSAAAPLGTRLGHFFRGAGVNVVEGYGLTECSPCTHSNTPEWQRIGSVGRPIPGCTTRIASDGEVLVKGPMVFQGYWNNETATKEMIDEDGWLHTGDVGVQDDDGFLKITGRKKDLIITSAGKNVAPAVLEDRLRAHFLVSQCLVVGDAKPYVAALVTLDPDAFAQWKSDTGKPADAAVTDLRDDADLKVTLQAAVDDANKAVSQAEAIKRWVVLADDFTEAGGQLTPTLKVRRNVVMEQCAEDIASLYPNA